MLVLFLLLKNIIQGLNRCKLFFSAVNGETRVKRQDDDGGDEVNPEQLCDGRPADEYFRLTTEGDCRDVVRQVLHNGLTYSTYSNKDLIYTHVVIVVLQQFRNMAKL